VEPGVLPPAREGHQQRLNTVFSDREQDVRRRQLDAPGFDLARLTPGRRASSTATTRRVGTSTRTGSWCAPPTSATPPRTRSGSATSAGRARAHPAGRREPRLLRGDRSRLAQPDRAPRAGHQRADGGARGLLRSRLAALKSSSSGHPDGNPEDGTARGFDAIVDNPLFAGGPFSFWQRQGIKLTGTNVNLVNRFSLLPDLRSSKDEGRRTSSTPASSSFNLGVSGRLTPNSPSTPT